MSTLNFWDERYAGEGYLFGTDQLHIGPRVAVRASQLGFTPTVETGGGPALRYDADNYTSLQGRAGAVLDGAFGGFRPFASAYYVREFEDRAAFFTANFANGIGPSVAFALPSRDDEGLTEGVGVPVGARARFKGHDRAAHRGGFSGLEG